MRAAPLRRLALAAALACAAACTSLDVQPVPAAGYPIERLCIERNPNVVVEDLLPVIESGVARHGIAARVVQAPAPADCEYTLWYDAKRRWDIRPVLGWVELRVRHRGETIGGATWVARPSLSPFKWQSTATRIGPVLDELFAQFPRGAD